MIPLWTIPMAIVTGNTLIVKPSERDPGAAMIIAEYASSGDSKNSTKLYQGFANVPGSPLAC